MDQKGGGGKSGFRDSEVKIDLFGLTSLLLNGGYAGLDVYHVYE